MSMRKPHKSTLRALAKRFRAWFLTVPEIEEGFEEDLCCACAIASEALARFLQREGFDAKFVEGAFDPDFEEEANHCWVEVADKWIVDITAKQFDSKLPGVYIVPIDDEDYEVHRTGQYALRTVRKRWPREQTPLGRKLPIPKRLAA